MEAILYVLIFIVCVLLILVILVQNPKGGGLSAGFGSAGQLGGVRKTTDFLEKATWTFAIALFAFCLFTVAAQSGGGSNAPESDLQEYVTRLPQNMPQNVRSAPQQNATTPQPAQQPAQPAQ